MGGRLYWIDWGAGDDPPDRRGGAVGGVVPLGRQFCRRPSGHHHTPDVGPGNVDVHIVFFNHGGDFVWVLHAALRLVGGVA